MNIVIRNYLAASHLLQQEPDTWDAIVILDSGLSHTEFVEQQSRRHVYLRFDDVVAASPEKRPATTREVRTALDFAADSENLLVSCRAGQARSAAIAFIICFKHLSPEAAYRLLDPRRHAPNSLVLDIGARLLEDSDLLSTYQKWKHQNRHTKLSDHLDEIEREFDELESRGARNRILSS